MTLPVVLTAGTSAYNIQRSLRFRSSASAYLSRTPASAGNQTTWTWSGWVKLGALATGTNQCFFGAGNGGSTTYLQAFFDGTSQALTLTALNSSSVVMQKITSAVYRDPSAWYHIVLAYDSTQATSTNRIKIYVNGLQITSFSTNTDPAQNTTTLVNSTSQHTLSSLNFSSRLNYLDGYLAEVNFIDGQALTPSSFGQTDSATGVWQPAKYTGTYGTNGFYLPFTDTTSTTTISEDFSGNNNDWTSNNISLTSGATYDSMTDVPTLTSATTANYCVLNPLNIVSPSTISGGNLNFDTGTTGGGGVYANWNYPESGKFYHELSNLSGVGTANGRVSAANVYWESNTGDVYISSVFAANVGTWNDTNTLGFAADCGAKTIALYRNNSLLYTASAGNAMFSSPVAYAADGSGSFAISGSFNFGQRPFAYTPPTGFVALNTFNLPTPTIGATASSQANKYMDISLYTGTGSSQSITGLNFQPDWTWIKGRSGATDHGLYDAVRGVQKQLESNNTDAETTETTGLTAFNSNGFTVGALAQLNTSSATYVGWNWKANGSGSTNTAGSITSTVSANTTAGFSIVTYTGSASAVTVGHGLGVAPSMVIVKARGTPNGSARSWFVYHTSIGATKTLYLDLTDAAATTSGPWNNTAPTSTVFSLGTEPSTNWASNDYVAYCFAQVAGYSAFGSYTGNGSNDGPFVFTGFRPKYVLIKASSTTGDWWLEDTTRNPYNAADLVLFPNTSGAESGSSVYYWDFLSNGFKLRSTSAGYNGSGNTYIYMAFAEFPFRYSLAR